MMTHCPSCRSLLLFAPRAPEGTPKYACINMHCVNAHGIVQASFDFWDRFAVEYNETPQEKENTMPTASASKLSVAKDLASAFGAAQYEVNDFLAPYVREWAAFQADINPRFSDLRDAEADQFVEIDGSTFYLRGEESYLYGETYTPNVSLPFDFVEDPEAYMAKVRKEEEDRKTRAAAKKKADAESKVNNLRRLLAKAEEDLAKATETGDPIKATANITRADLLRNELAQNEDQG